MHTISSKEVYSFRTKLHVQQHDVIEFLLNHSISDYISRELLARKKCLSALRAKISSPPWFVKFSILGEGGFYNVKEHFKMQSHLQSEVI